MKEKDSIDNILKYRFTKLDKFKEYTNIFDRNGVEARDGDIIQDGSGFYEVYWHEHYQWSYRMRTPDELGVKVFQGSLRSSRFFQSEDSKWLIISK